MNSPRQDTNRVLLMVEDDKDITNMNRQMLSGRGYDIHVAYRLSEAREKLAQITPMVILLDVDLPDGNGFDFCKEIRPNTTAHIIFLTAKRTAADMARGFASGGDAYMTKPHQLDELRLNVETGMRRAQGVQ